MKPEFNYDHVPYDFVHCQNSQCKRAEECLRHLAALRIPRERATVTILNPSYPDPSGEGCAYFKANQTRRFDKGISRLFDSIPHGDAIEIKQQMIGHFNRTYFYRLWRKERLFTPEQQEYVRQLFLRRGIQSVPEFDEYIEQYEY